MLACLTHLAFSQTPAQGEAKSSTLAPIEKEYKAAKAAYKAKPAEASKAALVKATVKFATATMTTTELGPKVKYPAALRLYREALKLDPKNKEALNNKQMIEDIYKSMHRPIPK